MKLTSFEININNFINMFLSYKNMYINIKTKFFTYITQVNYILIDININFQLG